METTININVVPGREYKIVYNQTDLISVYYNKMLVAGTGLNNRFIALAGVNTITITSDGPLDSSLKIVEYLRNFYDINDGQGGMYAFKEKWIGEYGFRPDWMTAVNNRLISFLNGNPHIHNGANNSFYGQIQDSVVAFPHNDAGNIIKTYDSFAVEGDQPDRVHVRTEVPYKQSTDLIPSDFDFKEGVLYAPIYRDRLSPNVAGSYEAKMFSGDKIRGEIAKFQVVFSQPSTKKEVKFVNINYDQSKGQTV